MESIVAPLGSDDIDSGEEALDELLELIYARPMEKSTPTLSYSNTGVIDCDCAFFCQSTFQTTSSLIGRVQPPQPPRQFKHWFAAAATQAQPTHMKLVG